MILDNAIDSFWHEEAALAARPTMSREKYNGDDANKEQIQDNSVDRHNTDDESHHFSQPVEVKQHEQRTKSQLTIDTSSNVDEEYTATLDFSSNDNGSILSSLQDPYNDKEFTVINDFVQSNITSVREYRQ